MAGSVAVTPVVISPVTPVEMSPVTPVDISPVAVAWDGGGAVTPVDMSPAKADSESARANTNTAQSRRKVFIVYSLKVVSCSLAKVFLLL